MSGAAFRGADGRLRTVNTGRLLERLRAVSRGCLLVVEIVLGDPLVSLSHSSSSSAPTSRRILGRSMSVMC